ncbi:MAG: hypothetical protein AB7O97_14895 [Planctomycetota bacterium]
MKPAGFVFHWFSVVVVTGYMSLCACWLMLRGKLDGGVFWRVLRSYGHRRWRGPLAELRPEHGKAWLADVPKRLCSDADVGSRLVVLEDGVPLSAPHQGHDAIRQLGGGRYSHWAGCVYFATSDGSDPRSNGRAYTAEER